MTTDKEKMEQKVPADQEAKVEFNDLEYQDLVAMREKLDAAILNKRPSLIYEKFLSLAEFLDSNNLGIKEFLEIGEQSFERKNKTKKSPITLSEIIGNERKLKPKYRLGQNTWSGRGKHPKWLVEQLENGHTMEEFLISNNS